MRFFSRNGSESWEEAPLTVADFMQSHPEHDSREIARICRRLVLEGALIDVPLWETTNNPVLNGAYRATKWSAYDASYGAYNFLIWGFPLVREHFKRSVLQVVVEKPPYSDPDIGTCFLVQENRLITARHNVHNMFNVHVPAIVPNMAKLNRICVPMDKDIDLALLEYCGQILPDVPPFQFEKAQVLDEIMTLGYPPVCGFDAPLFAEVGRIASELKATTGRVVAEEEMLYEQKEYLLISARVKGGNSGGPVVNKVGRVVGVVTQQPLESHSTEADTSSVDTLGYGLVTPFCITDRFISQCESSEAVEELPFKETETGFRTSNL